ncbi:phage tail protein [Croceicoccus sp. YJ47]|uniref:phage tail protein n=1 Tax=Croceicoccus sp. YJ47 TaxID=2798724 RepID=UPI001922FAD8|nr:phage tail protein [Croceicoccus sp. YJ47]QQN73176.1 phage tail protein [Croceicoccus sp. YJ47]
MRKHDALRAALTAAFPDLTRDPQALSIYIDKGRIAARAGPGGTNRATGFEWRYTLNVVLLDFAGDPNRLAATVLEWIRAAQPERLQNHTAGDEAFSFEVDILDDDKADIAITIALDEAVDIAADGTMSYRDEPDIDPPFEGVPPETSLDAITLGGAGLLP